MDEIDGRDTVPLTRFFLNVAVRSGDIGHMRFLSEGLYTYYTLLHSSLKEDPCALGNCLLDGDSGNTVFESARPYLSERAEGYSSTSLAYQEMLSLTKKNSAA